MQAFSVKRLAKYLFIVSTSMLIASNSYAFEEEKFAPDFTLKSNTGENIQLSDLRGQVVMVNFCAAWSGSCRRQLPLLEKIYQRYNEFGFTIISIDIDPESDASKRLINDLGLTYPVLFDDEGKAKESYAVGNVPSSYFIDSAGKLSNMRVGFRMGDEKKYKKIIRELLRE